MRGSVVAVLRLRNASDVRQSKLAAHGFPLAPGKSGDQRGGKGRRKRAGCHLQAVMGADVFSPCQPCGKRGELDRWAGSTTRQKRDEKRVPSFGVRTVLALLYNRWHDPFRTHHLPDRALSATDSPGCRHGVIGDH